MFKNRIVLAAMVWLSFFAGSAAQAATTYDYTRVISQSGMVFVPYTGSQTGPVYYTQFTQSPTGVGISGDLRKITVYLRPTAHVQGLYNPFIAANGISDARLLPIPAYGACQPTQEIRDLLSFMPVLKQPAIIGGGYPNHCGLVLYFPPSMEQQIVGMINSGPVMTLQASIPMCAANSPSLDVGAINQELIAAGVLQVSGTGDLTGNYWDVVFEATRLALINPSLFVTADPKEGWEIYMKLFQVNSTTGIATMPVASQGPAQLCAPAPLVIQYGQTPAP